MPDQSEVAGPTEVRTVKANGIEIAYETFGRREDPPVLLVMGLGTQMLGWPDDFCRDLAGRGFFVVRFDNRDVGLSTHFWDSPPADVMAVIGGDVSSAPYRLSDMADDAAGLLDALELDSAHIVGVSMGGMIGQMLAIRHPTRVRSLVSIMSTTGDPTVGQATQEAVGALLRPPAPNRDEAIAGAVGAYRIIGSPGFELDEDSLRDRAGRSYDRAYDPAGFSRQLGAIWASGDRTAALAQVKVPMAVIHGEGDPLVHVSGGRATAAAVPGCELDIIEGMGHDLPRPLWNRIIETIEKVARRADAGAGISSA